MTKLSDFYNSVKQLVIAGGVWYFAPYRHARKFFFTSADFAEKVFDWELPRKFQRRHPVLAGFFPLFIWLPFSTVFFTFWVMPSLTAIVLALIWPWVFTLVSFLLLNLIF